MANIKFKEKEIIMELCGEIVTRLEEKAEYNASQISEYEERGIETLGTWEEMQYNDCKRYLSAIDKLIAHLEKLI